MFKGTADIYEPAYGHCGTRDDANVSANGRARVVRTAEEEALAAGLDSEAREEGEEDKADDDTRIGRSCYLGDAHSSGRVLDLPQARGHGAVEATVVLGKSHPTRDDEDYYYLKGDMRKFRGWFLNGSIASAPSASTSDPVDAMSFFLFPYGKLD